MFSLAQGVMMNKFVVSGLLAAVVGMNFFLSAHFPAEVGYHLDEAHIALVDKAFDAQVQENEKNAVSPVARTVMAELSYLLFQAMEDGIEEACDENDRFSYVVYVQKQKDIFSKVMVQVEQLLTARGVSLEESDVEAISHFALFIIDSFIKFMEENPAWNLKFIEAKTGDEALEMHEELVKALTPMAENFARAYKEGETAALMPAEPKVLNSDEADFSQQAVQVRITASLEQLSSVMEKETQNFLDKCTDAEDNFNAKQFIGLQGAFARKQEAVVNEWMTGWKDGIAAVDLSLLQEFLCLYLPTKLVQFQAEHPDLVELLLAAKTKAEAKKVMQLHIQAIRQASKTFVAERCSMSAANEEEVA